jgi:hypothetical protein
VVVTQVMAAVDTGLRQLQLGGRMGPQELTQALGSMLVSVEGALGGDWATLLVGSDVFNQSMGLQQGVGTVYKYMPTVHHLATCCCSNVYLSS